MIFELSCQLGEVIEDCREANVTPVFKNVKKEDPGNWVSQPYLDPWEGDEAANPGNHCQAHEGQEGSLGVVSMDAPRGSHA